MSEQVEALWDWILLRERVVSLQELEDIVNEVHVLADVEAVVVHAIDHIVVDHVGDSLPSPFSSDRIGEVILLADNHGDWKLAWNLAQINGWWFLLTIFLLIFLLAPVILFVFLGLDDLEVVQ